MRNDMDVLTRRNYSMPLARIMYHLSPSAIWTGGEVYAQNLGWVSASLQMHIMQTCIAIEAFPHNVPCSLPRFWFTQLVKDILPWYYPYVLTQALAILNPSMLNTMTMNSIHLMWLITIVHQYQQEGTDNCNAVTLICQLSLQF
jgi:hypothetical protein